MQIRGRDDGGVPLWHSPPPAYEPLCGPIAKSRGITMNLFNTFVSMEVKEGESDAGSAAEDKTPVGEILDIETFVRWLGCIPSEAAP